jgi:hypothetical protein
MRFALGFAVGAIFAAALLPAPAGADVVVYEDGAGVRRVGDQGRRAFPEGAFARDCAGNGRCGR